MAASAGVFALWFSPVPVPIERMLCAKITGVGGEDEQKGGWLRLSSPSIADAPAGRLLSGPRVWVALRA